jgi:hypothetical protein
MLWHRELRHPQRLPDQEWSATLQRIRGEFDEMPCTRLTLEQARAFFGLKDDAASRALLERLTDEGFLERTPEGAYARRIDSP